MVKPTDAELCDTGWDLLPKLYLHPIGHNNKYVLLDWLTYGVIVNEPASSLEEAVQIAKKHIVNIWGTEDLQKRLFKGRATYLTRLSSEQREEVIQAMPECEERRELLSYMVRLRLTS